MDRASAKARVRSFALGGLVAASAALAAARRRRLRRASRMTPPGLAAFEEAPCYRELLEREAEKEQQP
jgi:hypothetical protein